MLVVPAGSRNAGHFPVLLCARVSTSESSGGACCRFAVSLLGDRAGQTRRPACRISIQRDVVAAWLCKQPALDVQPDDKQHQRDDKNEPGRVERNHDLFIGRSPANALVRQKHHVPAVEQRNG